MSAPRPPDEGVTWGKKSSVLDPMIKSVVPSETSSPLTVTPGLPGVKVLPSTTMLLGSAAKVSPPTTNCVVSGSVNDG